MTWAYGHWNNTAMTWAWMVMLIHLACLGGMSYKNWNNTVMNCKDYTCGAWVSQE